MGGKNRGGGAKNSSILNRLHEVRMGGLGLVRAGIIRLNFLSERVGLNANMGNSKFS